MPRNWQQDINSFHDRVNQDGNLAGLRRNWGDCHALNLQRMVWMPSPPLAPDDGPIDLQHLGRMTLGEASLERQVLAIFLSQTDSVMAAIATLPADAAALAHKLKGSARAIGARYVGDAADRLESILRAGCDPTRALAELREAAGEARSAIAARLRQS